MGKGSRGVRRSNIEGVREDPKWKLSVAASVRNVKAWESGQIIVVCLVKQEGNGIYFIDDKRISEISSQM